MIKSILVTMAEPRSTQQPDSVFTRPARGRRSKPALSRDRIVAGTIALLDREGASALTMRKVAAELGVHATSLYWHVERREDLVDLAVDGILAEAAAGLPGADTPWDTAVKTTARRFYAALTAHAWAAELAGVRPLIGPNAVALSRRIIAALGDSGVPEEAQAVAIRAIANQMLGAAMTTVAMRAGAAAAENGGADEALSAAVSTADALAVENAFFDEIMDLLLIGIRSARAG
jgi:AcrR family transcriptional regulator